MAVALSLEAVLSSSGTVKRLEIKLVVVSELMPLSVVSVLTPGVHLLLTACKDTC